MLRIIYILLLLFQILSTTSCESGRYKDDGKTVFRYNESSGISSLDPAFARDQANIWADNQLYNGLVQLDQKLNIKACIAKNWEISGDGLLYTFHLRQDVYFHSSPIFGKAATRKVTASDFVYSFNRLVDPKLASPGAWVFSTVEISNGEFSFNARDDSTLTIKISKPFPPFLGLLSMQYCSVIPHEAIEVYGVDFRQHPVGTGPFRFGMWKEGVKLVLLKNPLYFEKENGLPLPYLDAVAVTFIVDKQTAFLEFIKGNLDFISGIDASYKDEILTKNGELKEKYATTLTFTKEPYLNTEYLGILIDTAKTISKNSPSTDLLVRQAINMGFDRVKMMRYLRNNIGIPGTAGIVPAGLPFFNQKNVSGYSYNPGKARELLIRAGFPDGKGLPVITLTTNPSYIDLCKFIQSQLSEIGIKIKIDVTPPATLREMIAQSQVNFFRASWIADYPDAENYLSLFYSKNFSPDGPNYTHYSSAQFDKMYEQCFFVQDDSLRGKIYEQMDTMIMKQASVVVLFYDEVLRFTHKNISGLGSNPLNLLTLKQVKKEK